MGIFEILDELERDFFGTIDGLCEDFGKVIERENEKVKGDEEKKGDEDFSSYTCSKKDKYVNGEHVSHDEEIWKDGKCVKDEHYCKDNSLDTYRKYGKCGCNGSNVSNCKSVDSKIKENGDIEYTIEFNDEEDTDSLKKKNYSLRKAVNQLSADAEKDHKTIESLRKENESLKKMMAKLSDGMKCIADMIATMGR